jgi:hypothetical protein
MSKGQIWVQFDKSQHLKFQIRKNGAKDDIWDFAHSELSGSTLGVKLCT